MKVTGTNTGATRDVGGASGASGASGVKEKRHGGSRASEIDSGVSDKVTISGRAKEVAKAKELAKSSPDIDEAKVAKLKAAIHNGSYSVDADKVADRLVDEHLSMPL